MTGCFLGGVRRYALCPVSCGVCDWWYRAAFKDCSSFDAHLSSWDVSSGQTFQMSESSPQVLKPSIRSPTSTNLPHCTCCRRVDWHYYSNSGDHVLQRVYSVLSIGHEYRHATYERRTLGHRIRRQHQQYVHFQLYRLTQQVPANMQRLWQHLPNDSHRLPRRQSHMVHQRQLAADQLRGGLRGPRYGRVPRLQRQYGRHVCPANWLHHMRRQ